MSLEIAIHQNLIHNVLMKVIKRNISLIIGISIPILMIIFVAGSIYLPGLLIQPQTNFLYVSNSNPIYLNSELYSVADGKIIKTEAEPTKKPTNIPIQNEPQLFIHNVVENKSQKISFEKAQNLDLDSSIESPDGFEVVYGSRDSGFLFFSPGRDYDSRYLKGHNISKRLNLEASNKRFSNNIVFLGWIK